MPDPDNTTGLSPVLADDDPEPLFKRLYDLRRQRQAIDTEIKQLLNDIRGGKGDGRPVWNCKRCGHEWLGLWANRPPRGCPRCGSTGWMEEPLNARARRPSDPPNPRWKVKAKHRTPDTPAPVVQAPAPTPVPPASTATKVDGLTPPPKLGSLVPSQSVRFAEDGGVAELADAPSKGEGESIGGAVPTIDSLEGSNPSPATNTVEKKDGP